MCGLKKYIYLLVLYKHSLLVIISESVSVVNLAC